MILQHFKRDSIHLVAVRPQQKPVEGKSVGSGCPPSIARSLRRRQCFFIGMMTFEKSSFKEFYNRFLEELSRCKCNVYAGGVTFFIFMSFVPILALLCGVLSYTSIDIYFVMEIIKDSIPGPVATFMSNCLTEISSEAVALISVSVITILWSAGNGYTALSLAFDNVYHVENNIPVLLRRLKASLYTLIFVIAIIALFIFLGFGSVISNFIESIFPEFSLFYIFLLNSRFLFSWAIMLLFFMLAYTFIPAKHQKFKKQFPGALFASLLWTGFSYLYSFYIENFDPFSIYGSLTGIIVSLFWLYTCMYILLLGGMINLIFTKENFAFFVFTKGKEQSLNIESSNSKEPVVEDMNLKKDEVQYEQVPENSTSGTQ